MLRGSIMVAADADKAGHRGGRTGLGSGAEVPEGKPAKKVVVVPGRLVNIVV